jgi:hypothetical protein
MAGLGAPMPRRAMQLFAGNATLLLFIAFLVYLCVPLAMACKPA